MKTDRVVTGTTRYALISVALAACMMPVGEDGEDIDVTEQGYYVFPPSPLVISQVYGGAGASPNAPTYEADYVELFNRSASDIDIGGLYIMYAAADADFGVPQIQLPPPPIVLHPGQYMLIQTNGSGSLPVTPDYTFSGLDLSHSAGKIALTWRGDPPFACGSTAHPCTDTTRSDHILDLVGYGAASFYEGIYQGAESGSPVAALNETMAAMRKGLGQIETNSNGADFDVATPTPRNSASPRQTFDMFVRASSTGSTTCVVRLGRAMCWGANTNGKLGQGNTNNYGAGVSGYGLANLQLIDVGPGRLILDLTVGNAFICARLDNNSLKCWGNGSYIGLGGAPASPLVAPATGSTRGDQANEMGSYLEALSLAGNTTMLGQAGGSHVCVRTDAVGTPLKCFGSNYRAQVGWGYASSGAYTSLGDVAGETGTGNPAVTTGGVPGTTVVASAGGSDFNCVITSDNKVRCWGANNYGQLGRQSADSPWGDTGAGATVGEMDALHEVFVGTGRYATAIAAGSQHTCVIRDNDSVVCWGQNASGQLGRNVTSAPIGDAANELNDDSDLVAVTLGAGRHAVAITAGDHHTCALLDNGSVTCWGANGSRQLGRGTTAGQTASGGALVRLAGRTAVSIAAGASYTCAVLDDFTVRCWGSNAVGALGYDLANSGANTMIGKSDAEMDALGVEPYRIELIF